MKIFFKLLIFCSLIISFNSSCSQLRGINYQAVAIDEGGSEIARLDYNSAAVSEKTIGVRFSILGAGSNGDVLYQAVHQTTTDKFSLFSIITGEGNNTGAGTYNSLIEISCSTAKSIFKSRVRCKKFW